MSHLFLGEQAQSQMCFIHDTSDQQKLLTRLGMQITHSCFGDSYDGILTNHERVL